MRKLIILAVLLSLLVIPLPASHAQEGDSTTLPACSEEEITATTDALQSYDEGLGKLTTEYDLSVDPTETAYGATVVALDAASYEYWNTLYPELPSCAEAQTVAFLIGNIYDEYLTIGLLNNMAGWSDAAAQPEDAQVFADHAASRLENLDTALKSISDMSLADLVASVTGQTLESCSADQVTALADSISSSVDELSAHLDTLSEDPVLTFALTEGASYTFDTEVYSEVSTCAENQTLAMLFDLTLNETNIIAGLYANAQAEDAAGNADVAAALTTSADQRSADLSAAWDQITADTTPAQ